MSGFNEKAFGKATASKGGNYIVPGNYVGTIEAIKWFESQQDAGTMFFAVELLITSCNNVSRTDSQGNMLESPAFKAGDVVTWLIKVPPSGMAMETAYGNVKNVLYAALCSMAAANGADGPKSDAEVTGEDFNAAISESAPLTGVPIKLQATQTKTKKGNPFTRVVAYAVV